MTSEILSGAEVLFSELLPIVEEGTVFSMAWTGHHEKDNTIELIRVLGKTESAKEAFE